MQEPGREDTCEVGDKADSFAQLTFFCLNGRCAVALGRFGARRMGRPVLSAETRGLMGSSETLFA